MKTIDIILWVLVTINVIMERVDNAILITLFIIDNHIEDLKK